MFYFLDTQTISAWLARRPPCRPPSGDGESGSQAGGGGHMGALHAAPVAHAHTLSHHPTIRLEALERTMQAARGQRSTGEQEEEAWGQSFVLRLVAADLPSTSLITSHTTHTHTATPSSSTAQRSTRPPRSVGASRAAPPTPPPDTADAATYAPLPGRLLTSGPVAHMLKVSWWRQRKARRPNQKQPFSSGRRSRVLRDAPRSRGLQHQRRALVFGGRV